MVRSGLGVGSGLLVTPGTRLRSGRAVRPGLLVVPGTRLLLGRVVRPGLLVTPGTRLRSGRAVRPGLLVVPGTRLLLGRVVRPVLLVDRAVCPGRAGVVGFVLGPAGTLPRKVGARLLVGVRVTEGLGVLFGVAWNLLLCRLGELKLLDLIAGL